MKEIILANARWKTTIRLTFFTGLGLCLSFVLPPLAQWSSVSKASTDAKETLSIVAWYLQNGHWREDVITCLTQAEYVFYPQGGAASRITVTEDEE